MRKIIILMVTLLFVCMLGGCKDEASSDELLLSVLNSKTCFLSEEGETVCLEDYKLGENYNVDIIPQKYTFVDLDKDGTKELVTYVSPDYGAYMVFRYDNEKVYGFVFSAKSLIDLKEDGGFVQSSGAGVEDYVRITFEGKEYKIIKEAVEDNQQQIFKIEGKVATLEDMKEYVKKWNNKTDVKWTEVMN